MDHEKLYMHLPPGYIRLLQLQLAGSRANGNVISCSLSSIALANVPTVKLQGGESNHWSELSSAHWNYRELFHTIVVRKPTRKYLKTLSAPRQCSTATAAVSRSDALQDRYIALSYVWGASTQNRQIYVNNQLHPVTDNLYAALEQLQHCVAIKQGMRLWIDATCIDQDDLEERVAQIQIMHQIYFQAQNIVIWLGPETPSAKLAFTAVSLIADQQYEELEPLRPRQILIPFVLNSIVYPNNVPFRPSVMLSLWHLFSSPYWRRVWIVQEAALTTPESPVIWGSFCVSARQLQRAARYIDMNTGLSRAITYALGNYVSKPADDLGKVFVADRSLQNQETSPGRLWKLTLQVLRSSAGQSHSVEDPTAYSTSFD